MSTQQLVPEFVAPASAEAPEGGIDLFVLVIAVASQWRVMLLTGLLAFVVMVACIFHLKPQFVASASFVPQEHQNPGGNLSSLFADHGQSALYIGLLRSRSVEDEVIEQAGLMALFKTSSRETARNILSGKANFSLGADTIITIEVRDGNAQNAARIANAYLDALQTENNNMRLQQGAEISKFFEKQLLQERDELTAAETQMARVERSTGLVLPDSQTQNGLSAIATVRQQVTALEVQLAALLQSETEKNPEVERLRSQVAQLKGEEQVLEGSGASPAGAAPAAGQMPQVNLDIQRAARDVKYHDTLVNSLAGQFESARLDAAFSHNAFQIVDRAVVPEHKAWPPRKPYLIISAVFAIFLGFIAVIARLVWLRIVSDPQRREQLEMLRRAFSSR